MTEVDRQRVKEIFADAIEKPGAEREAYIDHACGDDAELRARVERLLRMHDTAGEFLAEPTSGFGAARFAAVLGESIGDMIGNYTLLKLIGEGGFGTVYLAEQSEPVRRQVALKIIKLGMDTRQVIARFDAEKQALAVMDHPNIARVFDAGATDTGRPYFVMEYVDGVPITQFCDKENLSARQRLELFMTVCSAVQHAHQKGIIHRDIKPSNVLVSMQDGDPAVKVIDFGIAKATEARLTEKTLFTEERQLIGTPQYMSPEQAAVGGTDIDTRADIYSLGVLLYELLAGAPPFDPQRLRSAAFGELQRIIREEDPPKPSTRLSTLGAALPGIAQHRQVEPEKLTKLVRGDLDWIVMKAMEKDRARRYETASALADDLRRHIADEPVLAGPPLLAYRAHKFVRRHQTGVIAGVAIALALILGLVLATIGFVHARRQQAVAEASRRLAKAGQVEAERQRRIAEEVSDFLTEDILAAADPHQLGRDATVRDALAAAAEFLDGRFPDEPVVEAAVRSAVGNTYWQLGELDSAEAHLVRSLELRRAALGDDHPDTLTAMTRLAHLFRTQGRPHDVEPMYREILEKRRRVLGPEHRLTLTSIYNLAGLLRELGRFDDALPLYEELTALATRTLPPDAPQRINASEGLAGMYKDLGRYDEAEPLYLQVLAARKAADGETHPGTLRAMNNLAVNYRNQSRFAEAHELYVTVLEVQRKTLTDDHPQTLVTMTNLAKNHSSLRQFEEAEKLYLEALERGRRVLGEDHRGNAITIDGLAQLYNQMQRFDEAEKLLVDAIGRGERADFPENMLMMFRHSLAIVYLETERFDLARVNAAAAVASARDMLPEGHWFTGRFLLTHGHSLLMLKRYTEAEAALLEAYELVSRALGPDDTISTSIVRWLVQLYDETDRPEEVQTWRAKAPPPPETQPSR